MLASTSITRAPRPSVRVWVKAARVVDADVGMRTLRAASARIHACINTHVLMRHKCENAHAACVHTARAVVPPWRAPPRQRQTRTSQSLGASLAGAATMPDRGVTTRDPAWRRGTQLPRRTPICRNTPHTDAGHFCRNAPHTNPGAYMQTPPSPRQMPHRAAYRRCMCGMHAHARQHALCLSPCTLLPSLHL
jgi:hypothetical protein